ncbi:MAG: peptidoglycan DD-metalloendopeptidase family protein [Alphaproteobacteria bacterium]|nr:peptidoglycan DD-metalloendopeptidase family protein [Alphaproteobacteria bacterium]
MKSLSKRAKNKTKVKYNKNKKPWFSSKEIIFRSGGHARVLYISSKAQAFMLAVLIFIAAWTGYSYQVYNHSGKIILNKDRELGETRDAYVDLMTEFMALHKNINSVITSIDKAGIKNNTNVQVYKSQVKVVEDKIKQITEEKEWANSDKINTKTTISEALLQRDIVSSERDALKQQLKNLSADVDEIKRAELEVMKKLEEVAGAEVTKIKRAIGTINKPLKDKGLYFNPLANKKNKGQGGPYIPTPQVKDKKLQEKMSVVFENLENWDYYKEVIQYVPIGKPVWSYWITSKFGSRNDPFKNSQAVHKGIDLASRTGNKINSMAKGKVLRANFSSTYGNIVEIDHENGFKTKYAHMHKIYIKKGDYVGKGETIGEVGSTGRSTGAHLHYEVLYMNKPVDPLPFIQSKL